MKIKIALLTTLFLFAVFGSASTALPQTPAKTLSHPVKVRYDVPRDSNLVAYQKFLQSNRVLEQMAEGLNELVRLPNDLTLTATQCGTVNAFYQPQLKAVQLCYEYVRSFNNLHINDQRGPDGKYDNAAVTKALLGTIKFTMVHEIGHALVDILDLPITGGEEDAVDQLAAVVLLSSEDEADTVAVIDAAYTKLLRANANAASQANLTPAQRKWYEDNPPTADEHSLDDQRFYNTVCLAYGSNTQL